MIKNWYRVGRFMFATQSVDGIFNLIQGINLLHLQIQFLEDMLDLSLQLHQSLKLLISYSMIWSTFMK